MGKKKPKRRVVAVKLGIRQIERETFDLLVCQAEACQDAVNTCWSLWYRQAIEDGLPDNFRETLALSERAKIDARITPPEKGDWPKLARPVFSADCVAAVRHRVPHLNTRCATLLVNTFLQKLYSQPSGVVRRLKLWQTICLGKEQIPTARTRLPIPFDSQNGSLKMVDDVPVLTLRIDRFEVEGRSRAASSKQVLSIGLRRKQRPGGKDKFADLVRQAAAGQRKWCGSQIVWHRKRRKWTVDLVVEADPLPAPLAAGGGARLFSPESGPAMWRLEVAGRRYTVGRTRLVEYTRRTIRGMKGDAKSVEGWGRPAAGRGSNGHGRTKATRLFGRITGRWDRITRSVNSQVAAEVAELARRHGAAAVTYERPGPNSVIESAGYVLGETPDWPVYDLEEKLSRKLAEVGAAFVLRDDGGAEQEPPQGVAEDRLESTAE